MKLTIGMALWIALGFTHAHGINAFQQDLPKPIQDYPSINALLNDLKKPSPRNVVALHTSRSLQAASYQAPRVLFKGDKNNYIAAFNTDSTQRGYDRLEIMIFDSKNDAIDLFDIRESRGALSVSAKNPNQCKACHGQDPKPIWEYYPIWPGAYAGDSKLVKTEQAKWDKFLKSARKNPRTKSIPFQKRLRSTDVYSWSSTIDDAHFERSFRMLRAHPKYDQFKFTLFGLLNGCSMRSMYLGKSHPRGYWLISDVRHEVLTSLFERFNHIGTPLSKNLTINTHLRPIEGFVLFSRLWGIDPIDFTSDNRFNIRGLQELTQSLPNKMRFPRPLNPDPELEPLVYTADNNFHVDCVKTSALARKAVY